MGEGDTFPMNFCSCEEEMDTSGNAEVFAHTSAGCAGSASQTPGVPLDNVATMFGTWGERLYKHVILL